jgi:hypothetical protein
VGNGGGVVYCTVDSDCPGNELCDASTAVCTSTTGSTGGGSRLVECIDDSDCAAGAACVDDGQGGTACASVQFTSLQCATDADCAVDQVCAQDASEELVCATIGAFLSSSGSGSLGGGAGGSGGPELAPRGCSVAGTSSAPAGGEAGGLLVLMMLSVVMLRGRRAS